MLIRANHTGEPIKYLNNYYVISTHKISMDHAFVTITKVNKYETRMLMVEDMENLTDIVKITLPHVNSSIENIINHGDLI